MIGALVDASWVGRLEGGSKLGLFEASDITAAFQPTHPRGLANGITNIDRFQNR